MPSFRGATDWLNTEPLGPAEHRPAPGASHGVDVDADGNVLLREGRLYQLVRQEGDVRESTVEITFADPGAEAYVFTFG